MNKKCPKCKTIKHLDFFYNCKAKKDGKSSNCKECDDIAKSRWRLNNLEKARAYDKGRYWNLDSKKRKKDNLRGKKNRLEMSDAYIRELIVKKSKLKTTDIPDDFVAIYRENLKLKRKLELTPKLKDSE